MQYVCKRTSSILGTLQAHCRHLPLSCKRLFYRCYILPLLDYCDTAWCGITTTVLNKLETHNRILLKILFSKDRRFPSASLYEIAKISPLSTRHKYHLCVLIHKILLNKIRLHMQAYNWFSEKRNTRNSLSLPRAASTLFTRSPIFAGYVFWATLPTQAKTSTSMDNFVAEISAQL